MQRGVSPVVSYVLVLTVLVSIAVASYIWASYTQTRMQDKITASNMENQLLALSDLVRAVAHGDINYTLTQTLYLPSGVVDLSSKSDWIRFIAQSQSKIYEPESRSEELVDSCNSTSIVILDNETKVKLVRLPYTDLYRGASGNELGQRVEMVICFPDIDLVPGGELVGKTGPVVRLTLKKEGYTGAKPKVSVMIW